MFSSSPSLKKFALTLGVVALTSTALPVSDAAAFCGFYVSGGESELFNDATQVALMRQGTKTVLSMQNNYKGPIKDFAMVIPVPVILQEEDVKTLPTALFDKLDTLTAPRLVEYWEQDPCYEPPRSRGCFFGCTVDEADVQYAADGGFNNLGGSVEVKAEFSVGEYDIVILDATAATALESWLKENNYTIPGGATAIFDQYIAQGMYFFVARINPAKVTFEDQGAVLSPLRFHYDSEAFSLPIRLGMVNSSGEQDLIVYTLGQQQRFEVANYENVTIPTNILVGQETRQSFGQFYTQLFDRTLEKTPGAVVTEYSWDATSCDPCPGPTLDGTDLGTLGLDVISGDDQNLAWGWTVTRLHARYGKNGISDDLVFKTAPAIIGGRGVPSGATGDLGEKAGATQNAYNNNFQGRYIMLNAWEGKVNCSSPNFGVWGGPLNDDGSLSYDTNPPDKAVSPNSGGVREPGERPLEAFVRENIEGIGLTADEKFSNRVLPEAGGCSCSSTEVGAGETLSPMALFLLGFFGLRRRQRRQQ